MRYSNSLKGISEMLHNLSLQARMIGYVVIILLLELIVIGGQSALLLSDVQEQQLSNRALAVANSIVAFPMVATLVESQDPEHLLQSIVEDIRKKSDAEFIVIGDKQGNRLTHPKVDKIGQQMVGGDNSRALVLGESYISRATGTLGPSLRAKVPIRNEQNEIVGLVSVGFLEQTIEHKSSRLISQIMALIIALIIVGVVSAIILAKSFRKAIFGLEPKEIGRLYKERVAIIESIREGIIATDLDNKITMINQAARHTLGLSPSQDFRDRSINDFVPNICLTTLLDTKESLLDQECKVNDKIIVINSIPIQTEGLVTGVVSSFRRKDQIDYLGKELSQLKEFAELLRAQTHEYSNKLHTISGLIQLGATDEAVNLIGSETSGYQALLKVLLKAVPDPIIAGCILGKYNRAKELNIQFELDSESNFTDVPNFISRQKIVTVLGNMLDNAYEAVIKLPIAERKVCLSMIDIGKDLIIEVEDSGAGVPNDLSEKIFSKGFSTSNLQGKGLGLSIVSQALKQLNGQITLSESSLGGALFTVYISKEPLQK